MRRVGRETARADRVASPRLLREPIDRARESPYVPKDEILAFAKRGGAVAPSHEAHRRRARGHDAPEAGR